MKYALSPLADKKIEQDMSVICREILDKVPGVETIILTGGFSRAEGPVKIVGKKVFPYNDYDIQVIVNNENKVSKEETDRISVDVSKKIGYRGISNFYPFKKENQKMKDNFYVDLKIDTVKSLRGMLPRIRTYELKNNSMFLHGKDLRQLIPNYSLREIPLSEGAKLLLDRVSQLVEYFSLEEKYDKEFLTYIIQQAYASCCTALLLLNKKYEIGYKKSMQIFMECYEKDFPELYKKIPDLAKKIEEFVNWKLNPKKKTDKDVKKEWFTAKENILEVAKYFFSRFLRKRIENTEQLADAILKMRKEFYKPYLKDMVKKKTGVGISLNWLFLPIVSRILNKKYNQRLKEMDINFKVKIKGTSADLVIFSSVIYLIDAVKENLVEEIFLSKGKARLKRVYPVRGENWEDISVDYANAYIAFFLQKIL